MVPHTKEGRSSSRKDRDCIWVQPWIQVQRVPQESWPDGLLLFWWRPAWSKGTFLLPFKSKNKKAYDVWSSAKPGLGGKKSLPFFQGSMSMMLCSFVCAASGDHPEGLPVARHFCRVWFLWSWSSQKLTHWVHLSPPSVTVFGWGYCVVMKSRDLLKAIP